jgi:cytochrome P450
MAEGNRAVEEFKDYLRGLIAWKRRHADEADEVDILWTLVQAHDAVPAGEEGLTELEILHNCIFMLNAGHDTTSSLLANGIDAAAAASRGSTAARAGPPPDAHRDRGDAAHGSPLQIGNRRTRTEVELCGERLPAGTFLHVIIASANRDPSQFADPDGLQVARDPNRHLAFGHGAHFCAGNALARLEATQAFGACSTGFPPSSAQARPSARLQIPDRRALADPSRLSDC